MYVSPDQYQRCLLSNIIISIMRFFLYFYKDYLSIWFWTVDISSQSPGIKYYCLLFIWGCGWEYLIHHTTSQIPHTSISAVQNTPQFLTTQCWKRVDCVVCRKRVGLLHHDGVRHRFSGGIWGAGRHQLSHRGWRSVPVWFQHGQSGPGLLQHPGRRLPARVWGATAGHATTLCSCHVFCQYEKLPWFHAHTNTSYLSRWVQPWLSLCLTLVSIFYKYDHWEYFFCFDCRWDHFLPGECWGLTISWFEWALSHIRYFCSDTTSGDWSHG